MSGRRYLGYVDAITIDSATTTVGDLTTTSGAIDFGTVSVAGVLNVTASGDVTDAVLGHDSDWNTNITATGSDVVLEMLTNFLPSVWMVITSRLMM